MTTAHMFSLANTCMTTAVCTVHWFSLVTQCVVTAVCTAHWFSLFRLVPLTVTLICQPCARTLFIYVTHCFCIVLRFSLVSSLFYLVFLLTVFLDESSDIHLSKSWFLGCWACGYGVLCLICFWVLPPLLSLVLVLVQGSFSVLVVVPGSFCF